MAQRPPEWVHLLPVELAHLAAVGGTQVTVGVVTQAVTVAQFRRACAALSRREIAETVDEREALIDVTNRCDV